MRDFERTKSMVERWNFLVTCLGNPYANEDELKETADEIFRLSAKLPIAAQKEFIDVADKADLQWWFGVWVRILCKLDKLPKMGCHAVKTYELTLFQELGITIRETAQDYNLEMPMLPEHFLSPWEAIEAAGGTITDEAVQLATDDDLGLFRAKYAFVKDMDKFLCDVKVMDGKTLADFYKKNIKRKGIDLKQFVEDVMTITKDREGQAGWNYEAIRKHPF